MNKDPNHFESMNDNENVRESFSFKKEENNPLLNENYVFKAEENKITWGNETLNHGKEENTDETHVKKNKEEEVDREQIEKITNSSTKISSAVTTTAVVVTSAVVLVAGVDIVASALTTTPPVICQIEETNVSGNTISFILALGDTEEEAHSLDSDTSCDIVVELTCLSYEDFRAEIPISYYGLNSGTFSDLEYATEYELNVYQYSLLDLERNYLLANHITLVTESKNGDNEIVIEGEYDPFGSVNYYSTINYNNVNNYTFTDYYVAFSVAEVDTGDNQNILTSATLNSEDPYSKQLLKGLDIPSSATTGYISFWGTCTDEDVIKENYVDESGAGRYPESIDLMLIINEFDKDNISITTAEIENKVYVQRTYYEGESDAFYDIYLGYNEETYGQNSIINRASDTEDYDNVYFTIVPEGDESGVALDWIFNDDYGQSIQTPQLNSSFNISINFDSYSEWGTYVFNVTATSHKQEDIDAYNANIEDPTSQLNTDVGVEVTLYETTVDFSVIHNTTTEVEPSIYSCNLAYVSTYFVSDVVSIYIDGYDPGSHIKSYYVIISGATDYNNQDNIDFTEQYTLEAFSYTNYYKALNADFSTINDLYNKSITLYGYSNYGLDDDNTQSVLLYEESGITTSSSTIVGCVYLTYIANSSSASGSTSGSSSDYELQLSIYDDTSTASQLSYDSYRVSISNGDDINESIDVTSTNTTISTGIGEFNSDTSNPDYYTVTTYGILDGEETIIFEEDIDFSQITRQA